MKRRAWILILGFAVGVLTPLAPSLADGLPACPTTGFCYNMCHMSQGQNRKNECQDCCDQLGRPRTACYQGCQGGNEPCTC
jgi:hypothetical protein